MEGSDTLRSALSILHAAMETIVISMKLWYFLLDSGKLETLQSALETLPPALETLPSRTDTRTVRRATILADPPPESLDFLTYAMIDEFHLCD